jgi:hypothetical protein
MLFEAIIDPISDISTIAAQSAVEYIADRSSLQRDGWALTAVRVGVAAVVFVIISIGGVLLIGSIIWLVFKLLFS